MDWLSQNWIWLAVGIGIIFFMSRMGMVGCGMGHATGHDRGKDGHQNTAAGPLNDRPIVSASAVDPKRSRHGHGCC